MSPNQPTNPSSRPQASQLDRRQPINIAWWGRASAVLAPIALIGGWTVAAAVQPEPFDSFTQTISALAAVGTPHRWIMTSGIAITGLCHLVTVTALRDAAIVGRIVYAVGGATTLLVAFLPLPSPTGSSPAHGIVAAVSFAALAIWPALATNRRSGNPALRAPISWLAAGTLAASVGAFAYVISTNPGGAVGLTERIAAGLEALWPLIAVTAGVFAFKKRRLP